MATRSWNKDRAAKRIDVKIAGLPIKDIQIKEYVRATDLTNLPSNAAYRVNGPLVLALDLQHRPYDRQTAISIGTEFSATGSFALRAGYLAKLVSAVSNSQP